MAFISKLSRSIVYKPWLPVGLCLLSLFYLLPQVLRLETDYSARIWFRTTDPLIKDLDRLEQKFGNDEKVIIAIQSPKGIFRPSIIKIIQELTEKTWYLPAIVRVDSLSNFHYSSSVDNELVTEPFLPENMDMSEATLQKKADIAVRDNFIEGQFISKDKKIALIFGYLKPGLQGGQDYRKIADALKKMIAEYSSNPEIEFHLSGSGAVNDAYREVSEGDLKKMLPIMLLVLCTFFFFIFRTLDGVLIPLMLVGLTTLSSFGFAVLNGIKFDNLTSALPGILIAVCIADSVHVLVSYYRKLAEGFNKHEAIVASIEKNFVPTFLTSFSTMIGFFSLTSTELLPVKHLGILAGFGTFYAWLLTIFFLCPLMPFIPHRPLHLIRRPRSRFHPSSQGGGMIAWIDGHRNLIFITVLLSSLAGLYIGTLNEVNSDPLVHFSKSLKVRQDSDLLKQRLGGVNGPEIIIDSLKKDGVKDPIFLARVEKLKHWIEQYPFVNKVISISDIIKQVYQNLNNGNPDDYRIPASQKEIAETLLLYSMGLPAGMDLNNRMSLDGRYMRQTLMWNLTDSKSSLQAIESINNKAEQLGLDITITGKLTMYHRMTDYIVQTFFKSISIAVILISLLMICVLKSWRLGLLSLLPNVIPLFYGVAFMTILKRPIDIGTSLVVSVCLGIAVDDTVHFLTHYKFLLRAGHKQIDALKMVMQQTAPALTYTTIILAVGFGIFVFADFTPNVNFGLLCALILTMALFIDLIFLPALLIKFKIKA